MILRNSALLVGLAAGLSASDVCLGAPSFDCNRAAGISDRLICASSKLSELDSQMALEYSSLRASLSPEQQTMLVQSQRQWVKNRSGCHGEACLESSYNDRLQYFSQLGRKSNPADDQGLAESPPSPAQPEQEKIPYASRAGMAVTVTDKSGIGTADAEIAFVHTRGDAKAECVDYDLDHSDACVDRVMHYIGGLSGSIYANCQAGIFTTVMGNVYAFLREHPNDEDPLSLGPAFEIADMGSGQIMNGSSGSGYPVALEILEALCPVYRARAEWIENVAQHKSDPSRYPDQPGPGPAPIRPGTGAVTPEVFQVDKEETHGRIVALRGSIGCWSADDCEIASLENPLISVSFSTAELPRALRLRLIRCGPLGEACAGIVVGQSLGDVMVDLVAKSVVLQE